MSNTIDSIGFSMYARPDKEGKNCGYYPQNPNFYILFKDLHSNNYGRYKIILKDISHQNIKTFGEYKISDN
jgi:hypothetical protein